MSARPRATPEWIVFGVSLAVLGLVVAAILLVWAGGQSPADPLARVDSTTERSGQHVVEVTVENHGDETAANVQVAATLTVGDEVTEAEQVLDFLAGGERKVVDFTFGTDPADGDLEVVVVSYADP